MKRLEADDRYIHKVIVTCMPREAHEKTRVAFGYCLTNHEALGKLDMINEVLEMLLEESSVRDALFAKRKELLEFLDPEEG